MENDPTSTISCQNRMFTLENVLIELSPWTVHGSLYPRYDNDADILVVESRVRREWTYGINIDDAMILDIDADRILANIDLMIPRRRWKGIPLNVAPPVAPRPSRKANLKFSMASIEQKSFHLPLEVKAHPGKTSIYILIGQIQPDALWVALSKACFAVIDENKLLGFYVSLE